VMVPPVSSVEVVVLSTPYTPERRSPNTSRTATHIEPWFLLRAATEPPQSRRFIPSAEAAPAITEPVMNTARAFSPSLGVSKSYVPFTMSLTTSLNSMKPMRPRMRG